MSEYDKGKIERPKSLEAKNLEELFESAFGKDELERQKVLHQKRMLKPDYKESNLNILECVFCGSDDVPNVAVEIELEPNIKSVISVKVNIRAAKCSKCGEEYYDSETTELVRKIERLTETKSSF